MNAITSIEVLPRAAFDAARDAAAAWRGRCLDVFARSEVAVTETLLVLRAVNGRGEAIKLPHLAGQRYEALSTAICAGGAFAGEGKAASAALLAFRQHDALRNILAHGAFTVTLDQHGRSLSRARSRFTAMTLRAISW